MNASPHLVMSDESTDAIPVSPVQIDLVALRAEPLSWTYRARIAIIVVASLGVHAAFLLMLDPRPQVLEEIPIEMIFEQPPEEEAPPPPVADVPPPDASAEPIDEPPATDFARKADQDREDGQAGQLAAAEIVQKDAAQPAQKPAPETPPPPPDPAPALLSEPPPAERPALRFTGLTPLPDYQFTAPPAKRSDLPGGNAKPGYLSTLYGLIIRKMPNLPPESRPTRGRVTFGVLSNGSIFQEGIAIPSGSPVLDAAALAAVRKASPFPAPPKGGPIYIRFEYGSD
jgi:protein TonB